MKKTLEEELAQVVETKRMFASEISNNTGYSEAISKLLDRLTVPKTEGKWDFKAFMDMLVAEAEGLATNYFGDGKNPRWTLDPIQLQAILDSFKNQVQSDGKLRDAVKNAIVSQYRENSRAYLLERGTGRGTRMPIDKGKNYGTIIAQEANPALIDFVKSVTTYEQLQRILGTVHNRLYANAEETYSLTGKVPPIAVKTAKQYAELSKN